MCTRARTPSDEGRILFPGRPEEALVRKEHDDPFGAVCELLPVGLRAELLEVLAHLSRVIEEALTANVLVRGLVRLEIRVERDLRVDDDLLSTRELDDEIGSQAAVFRRGRDLLGEVAVRQHPRDLDDALELNLAPAAPNVRRSECVPQRCGLLAEVGEAPAHLAVALRACAVEFLHAFADAAK
jgi:hypothetical protein